ncbi:hypothetical protein GCM10025738_11080 [Microbacterium fluvii]
MPPRSGGRSGRRAAGRSSIQNTPVRVCSRLVLMTDAEGTRLSKTVVPTGITSYLGWGLGGALASGEEIS